MAVNIAVVVLGSTCAGEDKLAAHHAPRHGVQRAAAQCPLNAVSLQAFLQGMNPQEVHFLAIRIRRSHVLEDALNTIAARADELKKPLRIIFSSGLH